MVVVAQLVRAPDCGSGGRGFKSPLSPFFLGISFLGYPFLLGCIPDMVHAFFGHAFLWRPKACKADTTSAGLRKPPI